MKAKVLLLVLLIAAGFTMTMTSCTSSKSGCKATEGYVGYGHR